MNIKSPQKPVEKETKQEKESVLIIKTHTKISDAFLIGELKNNINA